MDWQTFIQWFFIVASGGSIFGAWLAWASRKNGKETRRFTDELIEKIEATAEQRHKEIIEITEKRHIEVIELLEKGFGEVLAETR